MVGVDAAERNVKTATAHALETGVDVDYRATTAEALAEAGEVFDVVCALEIVEHVADVGLFLESLAQIVRPGGLVFLATLNRTPKSFLFAIVGAEYVLRWLPRGTHDWKKFIRPSELAAGLRRVGVTVKATTGVVFNPITDKFSLSARDLDVNYILHAVRD